MAVFTEEKDISIAKMSCARQHILNIIISTKKRIDELRAKCDVPTKNNRKENTKNMSAEKEYDLSDFLSKASCIDSELASYKSRIADLKKQQTDLINSPFTDESVMSHYEGSVEDLTQKGAQIQSDIHELEVEAEKCIDKKPNDEAFKSVSQQNLHGLSTQIVMATNEFFKSQSDYADKKKDRLKRQLCVRGESDVSDERLNEILEKESYNVFTDDFISEAQAAAEIFREVEERHKDILALEESVIEVNMLFKELNLVVSQQGETLDNIEHNIEQVEVHVESGNAQLEQAKEFQSEACTKKFCCFGIIIGVAVAILVIIIAVVATQTSG